MGISAQGAEHLAMKIGRAYKHIMEFDSLVVAHCKRTDLFTATGYDDTKNDRFIVRILISPNSREGDFVYNLLSGLDQLAWQLCLSGGGDPTRDTMFPIHERDDVKSEATFLKRVKGMPPDAVLIIRQLQPYRRAADYRKHPLWQLNELSNIDKHRLPAGRSTDTSFYIEPLIYGISDCRTPGRQTRSECITPKQEAAHAHVDGCVLVPIGTRSTQRSDPKPALQRNIPAQSCAEV